MDNQFVSPEFLKEKFGSKLDMYNLLSIDSKGNIDMRISGILSSEYLKSIG